MRPGNYSTGHVLIIPQCNLPSDAFQAGCDNARSETYNTLELCSGMSTLETPCCAMNLGARGRTQVFKSLQRAGALALKI